MKLNLTLGDKVALAIGGVVVWTVGLIPSAIVGGAIYHFRKEIGAFLIEREVKSKTKKFLSYFNIK